MEITEKQIKHLHKISRTGLVMAFALIVIMLFHVLIDFFYHI